MDEIHIQCELLAEMRNRSATTHAVVITFSVIGFTLSASTMTILILTAVLFKEWRQKFKNQVLLHFMISRFFFVIVRIVFGASLVFGFYHQDSFVRHYDIFFHIYTELILVAWMFIFTKTIYENLVIVIIIQKSRRMLKTALCAWLIPLAIAVVVSLVPYFMTQLTLPDLLLFLFLMKWPVLFYNAGVLVKTLLSLRKKNRTVCHNRPENGTKIIVTMVCLIFLFSLQQIIHDMYKIMYLIFYRKCDCRAILIKSWCLGISIVAIYYCPISVCYWVFSNKVTRDMWKNFIKNKLT